MDRVCSLHMCKLIGSTLFIYWSASYELFGVRKYRSWYLNLMICKPESPLGGVCAPLNPENNAFISLNPPKYKPFKSKMYISFQMIKLTYLKKTMKL